MANDWDDPEAAIAAVQQLLDPSSPLQYAGWRFHGEASDAQQLGAFAGIAAIWPHPAVATHTSDDGEIVVVSALNDYYHYGLYVVGANERIIASRQRLIRRLVLRGNLRPDILLQFGAQLSEWNRLTDAAKSMVLAEADGQARLHHVPLAFLLFRQVRDTDSLYGQFWHPQTLLPPVALEILRSLYLQHVSVQN